MDPRQNQSSNPWNKASASPWAQPHPVTSSLRDIMNEQTNDVEKKDKQRMPQTCQAQSNSQWSGRLQTGASETIPSEKKFQYTETASAGKDRNTGGATTTVVNVRVRQLRQLGYKDLVEWTKNPNHVYIGRNMTHYVPGAVGSMWQNPFKDKQMGRDECVRRYRHHIETSEKIQSNGKTLLNSLEELKGKTLGCWCHPERCHGHALVELIDEYVP